jgi:hypothetical protein
MTTFNIANVVSFRGFDVRNGQIDIGTDEYIDMLNEIYGDVIICGYTYGHGNALEAIDPVAFRCGLGDYESEIQSELEEAIENEDDSDITWEDGKEPSEADE